MDDTRQDSTRQAALDYHEFPKPGKLEVRATKPLANGRDLSRAYSPGVAEACIEIKADPTNASRYTSRGNLVAVVTNGSAVLGLGNIGAARRQAGDGGQGRPVQEIRQYRLLRPRSRRIRSRKAGRNRLRAGTDLRRDQPRRHQGAGLFHRRTNLPRADEHPGVSRRPARHGDRRRRRGDERAARGGQAFRPDQGGLHRRRGGGNRLPRHAA